MVSNYFTLMHLGVSKETCIWSQFNLKHNQMYFVIIMKLNVRKANAAMCRNDICFPKSGQILLLCNSKI